MTHREQNDSPKHRLPDFEFQKRRFGRREIKNVVEGNVRIKPCQNSFSQVISREIFLKTSFAIF